MNKMETNNEVPDIPKRPGVVEIEFLSEFNKGAGWYLAAIETCQRGLEESPGDDSLARDLEQNEKNLFFELEKLLGKYKDHFFAVRGVSLEELSEAKTVSEIRELADRMYGNPEKRELR